MDLTTRYLGLPLRTPLVAAASPLCESVDRIRRLEDAGIAAVVLPSLFEEDIREGARPDTYLDLVRGAKEAVEVPVVASLNGVTSNGWAEYARRIEQAGADALELNLYRVVARLEVPAADVEAEHLEVVSAVRAAVGIPVAVKIAPYFTSLGHFAAGVERAGAQGLVLFNRFYQPDLDLDTGRVSPHLLLSTQNDLRLPLRWIGLLHGRLELDFAATGGIQTAQDVLKMIGVGANVAMLCATLMQHGVGRIRAIEEEMAAWMEACEYPSVAQLRGRFSREECADADAFERAQYVAAIRSLPPGIIDPA